MNQVF